ncbi:MAG: recombinase family protein [Clostridia bacterium]|nr:recombinase family protein [Clostridia bacterium]
MAVIYGYARCSLSEEKGGQDIKRQTKELEAAGAEIIIEEREHGDKDKEKLNALLAHMEGGSSLVVTEVSRLARSTKMLCDIIDIIKAKHLRLVILGSVTIDCRNGEMDPMSQAFLQMAGIFSELELSMIRARVRSGLANARSKGKKLGRPVIKKEDIPPTFIKHYPAYMSGQMNVSELARVCELSRPTIYKYIQLMSI